MMIIFFNLYEKNPIQKFKEQNKTKQNKNQHNKEKLDSE